MIDYVYIYSISDKHKIFGKSENVSKYESLKEIRPKIKSMSKSDEFVKPMNGDFDSLDKNTEEDFCLRDILINENGVYKIYIKKSNNDKIIRYDNKNIPNYGNIINQKNSVIPSSQIINIKNKNNENMNKINALNEINDINNMNNIKLNNFLQINNMNNINNMAHNNNLMNQNNPNQIGIKFNDLMNDDFAKKYHIHFKTNNIECIILVNGRTKIYYDIGVDFLKVKKVL